MNEKVKAILVKMYGSVENALQAVTSKRAYTVALVVYFALSEMEATKVWALSILGSAYIISESVRHLLKQLREADDK